MSKASSITDYVFICLLNGRWWTYWDLKDAIHGKVGRYYDHPTISAAIRDIRNIDRRIKYKLPLDKNIEVVNRRRIEGSDGYEYKLNFTNEELLNIKEKLNGR